MSWVRAEKIQRIGPMARKRKATYVGSGKENSEPQVGKDISKLALAQRARRERERNLKQSTARISEQHLLRDTRAQPLHEIYIGAARDEHCANIGNNVHIREAQPLHEIYIGAARDEHCANIGNNVHIREDTQRANATPQAMHKSSYADKGKGLLTYANEKDTYLAQPLHEIDIGAAHDEHCVNIGNNVHIREIPHANSPLTPSRRPLNCFGQGSIVTQPIEKRQRVAQNSTSPSFLPNTTSTPHTNWPTLTDRVELCCEDEWEVSVNLEEHSRAHVITGRHNLGNMDIKCTHCKALHWMDERLTKSSTSNPLFGTCCFQGKIKLPTLITPPPPIRALYDGDDDQSISFRKHTREYNATNAFTSLGATLDPRMLTGRGPTSFTIHGELRHRVGSLLPQQGKDASYAQLYIYDPASALEVRNRRNQQLRKDVLQTIQETLLQVNPFVDKFRQAYAILDQLDIAEQTLPAHLHYSSSKDRRRYNLPTSDEIAVVIPGDGSKASGMRDIVLHLRGDNQLMQINECHPAYLPLHYVLLFPYGELGWEPEMKQWDVKNNRPTAVRLTQMEYYSHRLFERRTEYSTILRGGKLFQEFLMLGETGKSLYDFPPMPQSIENWSTVVGNRLIIEHRLLQIQAQQVDTETNIGRLNSGQRSAYDAIICSVLENKGTTFFLNGGAGTGKTFLYNTIAQKCRGLGHIVVTVASSGIASLLLEGGRTAHSTFSIPLDVLENSICGFTKQSIQAELFRETKMIIWDEVPMQHKYCVEAVDRTLRDIRDNPKPFGGMTVVLGGDFRQILPVVPKGVREEIVNASLRRSDLWDDIRVLTLSLNMRLNTIDPRNADFANFLMEVGTNPQEVVHLPTTIGRCQDLNELLSTVYPQLGVANVSTPTFLTERTILSARNDDVNAINCIALTIFPGNSYTYLAADKMSEDDGMDRSITNRYPNEYLNSLDPTGLPPFKLQLKAGCPIILLRNIAPKDGLCNGTRMMMIYLGRTHQRHSIILGIAHRLSSINLRFYGVGFGFNVRAVCEKNDAARKMLTLVMKCQ
ncbi:hypothetical protein RHMOL_Rhmol11G0122200 [Rhododendron molle]|uniref:Uncharacterized protein n=1 Tax=Rhododendron molle TaxID=49168 RepID=A0ACC0LRN1_RHOML|nr:hypothetical protein RHMOL_Rhmol11G0122200 [Rhododendron molle]